jgi:hypothetical protein
MVYIQLNTVTGGIYTIEYIKVIQKCIYTPSANYITETLKLEKEKLRSQFETQPVFPVVIEKLRRSHGRFVPPPADNEYRV